MKYFQNTGALIPKEPFCKRHNSRKTRFPSGTATCQKCANERASLRRKQFREGTAAVQADMRLGRPRVVDRDQVIFLWANGHTKAEIARLVGTQPEYVGSILRQNGLLSKRQATTAGRS